MLSMIKTKLEHLVTSSRCSKDYSIVIMIINNINNNNNTDNGNIETFTVIT